MPRESDLNQTLCADNNGFSLHAAVRCAAGGRQALEQLCRYITRPSLANERVQTNVAGQVVLRLKTPRAAGSYVPRLHRIAKQRHKRPQYAGKPQCQTSGASLRPESLALGRSPSATKCPTHNLRQRRRSPRRGPSGMEKCV